MVEYDRRKIGQLSELELYKTDIDKQIRQERRADNLEKLVEIRQQKVLWKITVFLCGLLNLGLLVCGLIGEIN